MSPKVMWTTIMVIVCDQSKRIKFGFVEPFNDAQVHESSINISTKCHKPIKDVSTENNDDIDIPYSEWKLE